MECFKTSVLLFIFLLSARPHSTAQLFQNQSAGDGQKSGKVGVLKFKTPEDSVAATRLNALILSAEEQDKPENRKKLDSLYHKRFELYEKGIVKTQYVYYPQSGFVTSDSLATIEDPLSVTHATIFKKSEFPALLSQCENLEELEIIGSTFNTIPDLSGFPLLKKLMIYDHRSKQRIRFEKNENVTRLFIEGSQEKTMPRSYKKFQGLELLELTENNLFKFPNGARKNRNLKEMSLQRNAITLKNKIKVHKYLERLALHENEIQKIPSSIRNLRNIQKLTFGRNKITAVSSAIGTLKKLEQLSLYDNRLTHVPKGVYSLRSLKDIDLFHNQIESLDPEFANWQNLDNLFLSHNKLVALPENIDTLKKLEGLYVWDNRLGKLPASIGNLKNLKYLRVNQNYLKELPASLLHLEKMEEIDISNNYITELSPKIYEYPNLKILAIANNPYNDETLRYMEGIVDRLRERDVFLHISDDSED